MSRVALVAEARGDLVVYPVSALRTFGVDAFVTSREGGVSDGPFASLNLGAHVGDRPEHVAENRGRVARALGEHAPSLVIVRQVHGAIVLDADEVTPESEADALVTAGEHALAVLVADCVPIVLCDDERVAVVHAGWRGLVASVVANALARFGDPRRVHAFVGPSISGAAYQVGPEVAARFSTYPFALSPDVGDRTRLDLRAVATAQLRERGLLAEHVLVSDDVTDGGLTFFSDRAERPCGRFALVAKRAS